MDLLNKYRYPVFNQVQTRYWGSELLRNTSHLDLYDNFIMRVTIVNLAELLQLSLNGRSRSIVWKFYEAPTKYSSDFNISQQSNIGSCSCI